VTHKPKTAALEALAADLLSDEGKRRIERHLASCDPCRRELAAIQIFQEAQREVSTARPELDWGKMELALAREARDQAKARRSPPPRSSLVWGGVALAVAAAALAVFTWRGTGVERVAQGPGRSPGSTETQHAVPGAETAPAGPELARYASGVVSMLAGSATFEASEGDSPEPSPVDIGARLERGALETAALSQAHVVLESPQGTAVARVALGPSTRLALGESRDVEAEPRRLETVLSRGRATVDAFETDARVVVLAGAYRVEIRAARCTIDLVDEPDGRTRVSVAAADPTVGEVVVIGPEGSRHVLTGPDAPRAWSSSGEPAQLEELAQAPADGALLQVAHEGAVRFQIDDHVVEGGPSLAMRVPPGLVTIRAFDAAGREFRTEVSLGPDGLALAPDALQPLRPRLQGYLAPEEITPVVRQSQRALQRCYEQALRLRPDLGGGLLRARVTLDGRGAVRRVQLEHDGAPASLEACVRQEAATWAFPPPGGPMSFELPLRFHATSP
jgi:hypothetical protein